MATTHVFIVDTTTFRYHLEYLFAGTGAKDNYIDFNNNSDSSLYHTAENNLVAMMADSQRVRKGDYVIFYLQQNFSQKVFEGKFYGIFKIKHDLSFLDNNDSEQFLKNNLKKSLTFRVLIDPYEIYSKGVTEWEALDEIKYIQSPNQMLWSLIYRKLKGNRGNTMITIYESERLFKLIKDKNQRKLLKGENFLFFYETQEIITIDNHYKYTGRQEPINILPRLLSKYRQNKSFESHLQCYIIQNIGRNINVSLDNTILKNNILEWIGNEVSCGVGMQRIDIMLSAKMKNNDRLVIPIELKAGEADLNNVIQIQRYVDWIEQYYIPNRISYIQPVLISRKIANKSTEYYNSLINSFREFNKRNFNCLSLKYVEFEIQEDNIYFDEIRY